MIIRSDPHLLGSPLQGTGMTFPTPTADVQHLHFEVHADGGVPVRGELAVGELAQEAGLPHARVADEEQLDEVVVLRRWAAPASGHGSRRGPRPRLIRISLYITGFPLSIGGNPLLKEGGTAPHVDPLAGGASRGGGVVITVTG